MLTADSGESTGIKWAAAPGVGRCGGRGHDLGREGRPGRRPRRPTPERGWRSAPNGHVLTADSGETPGRQVGCPGGGGRSLTLSTTMTLGERRHLRRRPRSPAAYNDLICILIARGTERSSSETIQFRFNNDSGSNYYWQRLQLERDDGDVGRQLRSRDQRLGRLRSRPRPALRRAVRRLRARPPTGMRPRPG